MISLLLCLVLLEITPSFYLTDGVGIDYFIFVDPSVAGLVYVISFKTV